jgi:transposase-like protein
LDALAAFEERWDKKYPQISQFWRANWAKLSTCFKYPQEVRRLIYTTNAIEGLNRQLRKVTKAKLVFPTDDSLLKMLYLAMTEITKKWTGRRQDGSMIHAQLAIFVHGVVDADAPLFSVKKSTILQSCFLGY